MKCPGLTCGINIVKARFLFKTVDLWSTIPWKETNNQSNCTWYTWSATQIIIALSVDKIRILITILAKIH